MSGGRDDNRLASMVLPAMRLTLAAGDHQAHHDLVLCPPDQIEFTTVASSFKEGGAAAFTSRALLRSSAQQIAVRHGWISAAYHGFKRRNLRRAVLAGDQPPSELVHSCGQLYAGGPWIADLEHAGSLYYYQPRLLKSRSFLRYVHRALASPDCRAIRVWSEAAGRSVRALFPDLSDKVRVIYPAVCTRHIDSLVQAKRANRVPRLLFVGRSFLWKGGRETLLAMEHLLRGGLQFHADFVSDIPLEYRDLCARVDGPVRFHRCNLRRDDLLRRFYSSADVFVLPTLGDTFGYAILEAMTFGIPVVAARIRSAAPELVVSGQNGFLVATDHQIFGTDWQYRTDAAAFEAELKQEVSHTLVAELTETLSLLVGSQSLRREIGSRNRHRTREGDLSAQVRNSSFELLYNESLVS